MKGIGSGKVLKSTPQDNVFLYYSDHGNKNFIAFPQDLMSEATLFALLKRIHEKKSYKQIVFYVEACFSGSMFLRLPKDWNMWVTTAANPNQSSYGTYCGASAKVQGVTMNTCLGDEYSVAWMDDTIANKDNKNYMFFNQFESLKRKVIKSEVCAYDDSNVAKNNAIDTVLTAGSGPKWSDWEMVFEEEQSNASEEHIVKINSRDVHLYHLKYKAMTSNDPWDMFDYEKELALTKRSALIFERFRQKFGLTEEIVNGETDFDCFKVAFELYKSKCGFGERDYRHLNDLTNACTLHVDSALISETISSLCDSVEFKV